MDGTANSRVKGWPVDDVTKILEIVDVFVIGASGAYLGNFHDTISFDNKRIDFTGIMPLLQ